MEENSSNHVCTCGKTFKQRSGLFKHSKKCAKGNDIFPPLSRKPCKEENCDFTFRYIEELRNHLETIHNLSVVSENLLFKSYNDFLQWKEEYEIKTVSSFTRNNIKKISRKGGRSTEYYYCHRSGQYKCMSKGKRRLKAQGSLKINNNCTAALKVTTLPNEMVRVFVCHTHYGHKMDLCHVKISKRDRQLLAAQMSNGIPKEKILHTLSPSNAVRLERKNLIMRKDLNNISKAYGVKRHEKAKQYRLNVEDYFNEVTREGTASVLLYKRRKEEGFVVPENLSISFRSQDFVFAFMNQFQKEIFQSFGNGIVCFDVTSDCSADVSLQQDLLQYDSLKIFSLVLIDDYGDGIPVAWLISNREDSSIVSLFFQQIKETVGPIAPKAVMSDRTSDCYNCWLNVFEGDPVKLLCSWHVYNEWREKMSQLEDQDAASLCYQVLCLLLEEQDMAKFVVLMQRCIKEMNDNQSLVGFGKYFCDEWTVIQEQWATCFRVSLGIDTNTHMESMHQTLKHLFFQEKFRKSPNKCLNLVLNFSSDLNMKRHEKHEQEKIKLLESHRIVAAMSLDIVKRVSPSTWYVSTDDDNVYANADTSGTVYSLVYVVEEVSVSCSRVCNVKCEYCQVCMHLFKCSCSESKPVTEICEHTHLVAFAKSQESIMEIENGNIVLHEEPNARDFEMLDHNYFEVAPKEDQHISVARQEDICQGSPTVQEETSESCNTSHSAAVPKENVTNCQPGMASAMPVLLQADSIAQLQSDRRLGVPILPKPPENANFLEQTPKLLGIIIIPKPEQISEPSAETLRKSLLQSLNLLTSKIIACSDKNALITIQGYVNAATNALKNPAPPLPITCPKIYGVTCDTNMLQNQN